MTGSRSTKYSGFSVVSTKNSVSAMIKAIADDTLLRFVTTDTSTRSSQIFHRTKVSNKADEQLAWYFPHQRCIYSANVCNYWVTYWPAALWQVTPPQTCHIQLFKTNRALIPSKVAVYPSTASLNYMYQ